MSSSGATQSIGPARAARPPRPRRSRPCARPTRRAGTPRSSRTRTYSARTRAARRARRTGCPRWASGAYQNAVQYAASTACRRSASAASARPTATRSASARRGARTATRAARRRRHQRSRTLKTSCAARSAAAMFRFFAASCAVGAARSRTAARHVRARTGRAGTGAFVRRRARRSVPLSVYALRPATGARCLV